MSKTKTVYICSDCGYDSPRWVGQCRGCGAWNTFAESKVSNNVNEKIRNTAINAKHKGYAGQTSEGMVSLSELQGKEAALSRYDTGIAGLNRVLGGGLVKGSVVLLSGSPGAGKSTILLQAIDYLASQVSSAYFTGEESVDQISSRATRLHVKNGDKVKLKSETCVERIIENASSIDAKVIIVDSIQTMYSETNNSSPGSTSQVKDCGHILTQYAKTNDVSVLVIGHVTKDGTLAGPKVLEHTVDCTIHLDTTTSDRYRTIKSAKNRFGTANEMSVFIMTESGMKDVKNPSAIFLQRPDVPTPGTVVIPYKEGNGIMLLEIQALVAKGNPQYTKRVSVGLDSNRNSMLMAVLHSRCKVATYDKDTFLNVVGGIKIGETASDLAVVLAICSAIENIVIPQDVIVMGEVGLGGEIRPVPSGGERLKECRKHDFHRAIIPASNMKGLKTDMEIIPVKTVSEAIAVLKRISVS